MPSSRGSNLCLSHLTCIGRQVFTASATSEAQSMGLGYNPWGQTGFSF